MNGKDPKTIEINIQIVEMYESDVMSANNFEKCVNSLSIVEHLLKTKDLWSLANIHIIGITIRLNIFE